MTKSEARDFLETCRDYLPRGGRALRQEEIRSLQFRETAEHEIYHCGCQTGDDIQSGPYYCGAIADFVANAPDGSSGVVAVCGRHKRKICP